MRSSKNVRHISHIDCFGGGQVWVENQILYVGHMHGPNGTSIYNVSDPRNPKMLAQLNIPEGWHSHKVRVANDIMVINHERFREGNKDFGGGLAIYDVSKPSAPRFITKWMTAGKGVHRFQFDGRYAYISPTVEGYIGNICMILDLLDPSHPEEVGRWWIPGQWQAGGEVYPWHDYVPPRCHHPLRRGNRLYVSWWHHGLFILDIEDMSAPQLIATGNAGHAFPHPTHTCLAMPQRYKGRDVMIVADEDVAKLYDAAPAFAWIYDITDETTPIPISTYQVDGLDPDGQPQIPMMGCHQPSERLTDSSIVPFAWFAQGLRLLDIADPFAPKEVGHFQPSPPSGCEFASSNDVTIDDRGLIYLIDRQKGIDILQTNAF